MRMSLRDAVAAFGREAPFEPRSERNQRISSGSAGRDLAELAGLHAGTVNMVGETSLVRDQDLRGHTRRRPERRDQGARQGRRSPRFSDRHDREQWAKLQTLPNLIYTDGNGFSLWRNGSLEGEIVRLEGDVETAGAKLAAPRLWRLVSLFSNFFQWEPEPPRSATTGRARLCRASGGSDGAAGTRLALAHQPRD